MNKKNKKESIIYSFPKKERVIIFFIGLLIILSGCILVMYELPDIENILSGIILVIVGFVVMSITWVSDEEQKPNHIEEE